MALNTSIFQGTFTSTQADYLISVKGGVDWVKVINFTNSIAATQWAATEWYWQRGMIDDNAFVNYHAAATQAISMSTAAAGFNANSYRGITLIDSSDLALGAAIAVTAGTNATRPVYTTADTGNLLAGAIVRISSTAHDNINGIDFTVDAVTLNTNFRLRNTLATVPGVIAGAGFWRYVAPNSVAYDMIRPRKRVIANITQAAAGIVTTLVNHRFQTGELVRIKVPTGFGMTELNDRVFTVTVVDTARFSINLNTTALTAFAYLAAGNTPFTPAEVIPVGVDPANNTTTAGALENTAFTGIILGTSDTAAIALGSPGGTNADVIYWQVGSSFSVDNQ